MTKVQAPLIPILDLNAQYQAIKSEIDSAIQKVFAGGQFILGPEVQALEQAIARYCSTHHAVGVASGTDALELALRACGVGPGDEVITTALSFFASAGAVASLGAKPVFVDIDEGSYTLDVSLVEHAITNRTKAIIPVHLYGHPCDMDPLLAIAKKRHLKVIEDCAQAIGAAYKGRRVGGFGDAGALSFYPTKNLGGYGDGGMVVTNDAELAGQIRFLRAHGSHDRVHHEAVSRNSRLDEIQAAVLRVKLNYLESWNDARREKAAHYLRLFKDSGLDKQVRLPKEASWARHVYHLFSLRVKNRAQVRQLLLEQGISTQAHYEVPLHLEPAFKSLGFTPGMHPVAEKAAEEVLAIPMHPTLSLPEIERVVKAISGALK